MATWVHSRPKISQGDAHRSGEAHDDLLGLKCMREERKAASCIHSDRQTRARKTGERQLLKAKLTPACLLLTTTCSHDMALSLKGKTAFITGASRGIGLEIGKLLASHGANVAVAAKTAEPHPKLPGTIHTAVQEIDEIGERTGLGSKGLAIKLDIREAEKVQEAIELTAERFGGLDIVINNASAINMAPTVEATPKSYDLMNNINSRGTWLVSRYALPHLLKSHERDRNPHILSLSPLLNYSMFARKENSGGFPSQFAQTASAYTIAKFGMSLCTFALAAETLGKVGCNMLWPYTLIGTSAMKVVSKNADVEEKLWRSPLIVAEAAVHMLQQNGKSFSAQSWLDEVYLRKRCGYTDDQIAAFSLGGKDTPLDSLREDLYITQAMRNDIKASRRGEKGSLSGIE